MSTRFMSLVQQKKLQWSQEREEMTKLYGLWFPLNQITINPKKTRDSSSLTQLNKSKETFNIKYALSDKCLPPIQKSSYNESNNCDVNKNTESSGYASETDWKEYLDDDKKKLWKSHGNLNSDSCSAISKLSHGEDVTGRLKWGDRGVGVGHLWEPTTDFEARLPEIDNRPGTPQWLQKSLKNKTHLRGYTTPVEPTVMREREHKRQKAIELQEAIRQQLIERDRKRKEERDLQIEEERKLEQRIKEQQEMERRRMETEIKKQKEKEEKETKKSKAMQEALAAAERTAKEVKMKMKNQTRGRARLETSVSLQRKPQILDQNVVDYQADSEEMNNLFKVVSSCDAHTSLTVENYFDDFKSKMPLVISEWTQTNCNSPKKLRKKMMKASNDRPKWGVHRSSIKYMKQSEKDPIYMNKFKSRCLYVRRNSDRVASTSGRSLESTDECKSASSATLEKYFSRSMPDVNQNRRNLKTKFQISPRIDKLNFGNVSCDSDEYQVQNNSNKKIANMINDSSSEQEEDDTQLPDLLNNKPKMRKYLSEDEKKKRSLDLDFP